jgi:hypothetical protein
MLSLSDLQTQQIQGRVAARTTGVTRPRFRLTKGRVPAGESNLSDSGEESVVAGHPNDRAEESSPAFS